MKPRQEPAPLTEEDRKIWRLVCCWGFHLPATQVGRVVCAEQAAQNADRRDADLMLVLTRARNGLRSLKAAAQSMYDSLTPHEQDVMRRLWGTRRP